MLINKAHFRARALEFSKMLRLGKFERVGASMVERAERHLDDWLRAEVQRHPSLGKTLK